MITSLLYYDNLDTLTLWTLLAFIASGIAVFILHCRGLGTEKRRFAFIFALMLFVFTGMFAINNCTQTYLARHQFRQLFGHPFPQTLDDRLKIRDEVVASLVEEENYLESAQNFYATYLKKLNGMPRATTNDIAAYIDWKDEKVDWERGIISVRLDYSRRQRAAAYYAGFQEEVLAVPFDDRME